MKRLFLSILGATTVGMSAADGHVALAPDVAIFGITEPWEAVRPAVAVAAVDVRALLTAARGTNPLMCGLAAQSVRNWGWGDAWDAPATPLRGAMANINIDLDDDEGGFRARRLAPADVQLLLERLASDDACERELAVRLVGLQRDSAVTAGLLSRLAAPTPALREVAALGLGYVRARQAVDPLIRALRDAETRVRANAAWALGRIDDGRANAPLLALFGDRDESVRAAAVVAVGQLDSTSSVAALVRVLRQDAAPSVRRVAAWALGQIRGGSEGGAALAEAVARDADPRVREMSAWALGTLDRSDGAPALVNALQKDADERVRESAAWALGNIGDRESSVEALGSAVEKDRSASVRGTAAWALGTMRGDRRRAPAGLLRALRDESEDTRLKAAWALGNIGDSAAIAPIRDALKADNDTRTRRALIRALLNSGGRSEVAMEELLKSDDPTVREAAVRGLVGRHAFDPWPWPWPRPRPFP